MPAYTIVINYPGMRMGGIESNTSNYVAFAKAHGIRVIWLVTKRGDAENEHPDVMDSSVERAYIKKNPWGIHYPSISFNRDEQVTMISFDPLWYFEGEKVRQRNKEIRINHLLILPHFSGNAYYPERNFKNAFIFRHTKRFMAKMYSTLDRTNCLRAYAREQLLACAENYHLDIKGIDDKCVPSSNPALVNAGYDRNRLAALAHERDARFEIIACARFDFPHKGYLLGLIDAYEQLKSKYPQVLLTIVGDGEGKSLLEQKIAALPLAARAGIELTGTLSSDELRARFINAHVSCNLAGSLSMGASCGIPSIVMRHYTYEAECYGFYVDPQDGGLSSEKGFMITPYLEEAINCDVDSYVNYGLRAYKTWKSKNKYDPWYLYHQETGVSDSAHVSDRFTVAALLMHRFIESRFFGINQYQ